MRMQDDSSSFRSRLAVTSGADLKPWWHIEASPWWTTVLLIAGMKPSSALPGPDSMTVTHDRADGLPPLGFTGPHAEARRAFADNAFLSTLGPDLLMSLIEQSYAVDLESGAPVLLPVPNHAIVVESGVIALPDGTELRRGTLIGPVGHGYPGEVARTRTIVRLRALPNASVLVPLIARYVKDPSQDGSDVGEQTENRRMASPPGPDTPKRKSPVNLVPGRSR